MSLDEEVFVRPTAKPSRRTASVTPADGGLALVETGVGESLVQVVCDAGYGGEELSTVIAFDPGKRTGWSVVSVYPEALTDPREKILSNIAFVSGGEFWGREDAVVDCMLGLVAAWGDDDWLVAESFVLRKLTADEDLLSPVRILAMFRYGVRSIGSGSRRGTGPGRQVHQQPAALAKGTVTDERLKAAGLYNPFIGQQHARDALRHSLTWLRRVKAENDAAAAKAARAARQG